MRRALLIALFVAGCDEAKPGANGADARSSVTDAWKAGGITTGPLEPAKVAVGTDCKLTTVKALEVLLCAYPTPEAAKKAAEAGLAWVGEATGAVKASGSVLVAVVDRRKTDPSGKTINQLLKLTPK